MSQGAQGTGGSAGMLSLLPFILIFFIIYFLMIRPQVRKQKAMKIMVENLRKGDKVVTTGGMVGIISGIKEKENTIVLKVDQNVKIEFMKTSVSKVIEKDA
ncbi:preprotein translocase subunit YajC [bacterium]|nr:preprotein translocase subunit YajC [bacterium]